MPTLISPKWLCAVPLLLFLIQGCGCDCGNPNSAQQAADCITNLRALGNGLQMYMQDWDEVMPANANTWTDAIFPYVKVDPPFHCPTILATKGAGSYGYAFNSMLAGKKQVELVPPPFTISTIGMLYDSSNLVRNAND